MDRIQNEDTVYQDSPKPEPLGPPRFTAGAARKARQVVALGPDFMRPVRRLWASLGIGNHRARILSWIALVALAGGLVGGLLAANSDHEGIDARSLAVGAAAKSQTDNPQPILKSKASEVVLPPARPRQVAEFEGPEVERTIEELRKPRSSSRVRKAYRVATIYPNSYNDFGKRKRGRKH